MSEDGRFASFADYRETMLRLLDRLQRELCVLETDPLMAGLESAHAFSSLAGATLGHPACRLRMIDLDPGVVERACPRLLRLLRQFSHAVAIHTVDALPRGVQGSLAVADGRHLVRRFHFEQPRGEWAFEAVARAKALGLQFDELWAFSRPAVTASVLGL